MSRALLCSAMANAGVPEEVQMLLTGHSTRRAHKTYTHHEESQVWRLSQRLRGWRYE